MQEEERRLSSEGERGACAKLDATRYRLREYTRMMAAARELDRGKISGSKPGSKLVCSHVQNVEIPLDGQHAAFLGGGPLGKAAVSLPAAMPAHDRKSLPCPSLAAFGK